MTYVMHVEPFSEAENYLMELINKLGTEDQKRINVTKGVPFDEEICNDYSFDDEIYVKIKNLLGD